MEDASDIFQQVWMELYQRLSDLRRVEALPAWLITVTRRHASKMIRSRTASEPLDDDLPDVRQQLSHIEREHALERALEQLPHRCRMLIDLLRSEEHTSELQSRFDLVCRLLLEKKKRIYNL